MKKLASVILVGVFVLAFAAGVVASNADPKEAKCYQAGDCDYNAEKVYVCCKLSGGIRCFWSNKYFSNFCDAN